MTHPDLARWNTRFDTPGYVFGEKPNAFLEKHAKALAPGQALCVADGEGRNGVWLARQGWDVVSLDFSDVAQRKAQDLAARQGVTLTMVQADVHVWDYPVSRYDLIADIFSQFSDPVNRQAKWAGMRQAVRPGGVIILVGYTPDQLRHGTGGPRDPAHLYTADLLQSSFAGFDLLHLVDEETTLDEGAGHRGTSAVIGMVARRPLMPRPATAG